MPMADVQLESARASDIYKRLASGEGADELVFESETHKSVNAWSRDGRFVVYDTGGPGSTSDLYVLPLSGDRRPVVLDSQYGFQQQADISPDGRLIAYASSESGRFEVIVKSFPERHRAPADQHQRGKRTGLAR